MKRKKFYPISKNIAPKTEPKWVSYGLLKSDCEIKKPNERRLKNIQNIADVVLLSANDGLKYDTRLDIKKKSRPIRHSYSMDWLTKQAKNLPSVVRTLTCMSMW